MMPREINATSTLVDVWMLYLYTCMHSVSDQEDGTSECANCIYLVVSRILWKMCRDVLFSGHVMLM